MEQKPLSEKEIRKSQAELVKRLFQLRQQKFNGNNSHLAREAGCGESTIRKIMAGNQNITVVMLLKLAHAFGVKPTELIKDL